MTTYSHEFGEQGCSTSEPSTCNMRPVGPGPAMMNAASAKESIPLSDPTLRDPNAALNKYDHRIAPAMVIGGVFVVLLVIFAVGLVVTLDENLRKKLRGWLSCGRRREVDGSKSPSNRSDITRVHTPVDDVETGMRMSFSAPFARGLPSPLRQASTEGKTSTEDISQPGQPSDVPILPARS